MYSVTVYKKTGFNSINIPDRPELLDLVPIAKRQSFPALDILQDGFLSSASIRSEWDDIKHGDYCKIGDWYYFIAFIEMTSTDVAHIILAPDFITTAGGIRAITFLDGITQRAHTASDEFGEWCEDDPYLVPAEPMIMKVDQVETVGDSYVIVGESSLDVGLMAQAGAAVTYVNGAQGSAQEKVTRFRTYPVEEGCRYGIMSADSTIIGTGPRYENALFPIGDSGGITNDVNRVGAENCRGLGIPEPFSSCVALPSDVIQFTNAREEVVEITTSGGYTQVAATYTGENRSSVRYIDGELIKSNYGGVRSWNITVAAIGIPTTRISHIPIASTSGPVKNQRLFYGSQVPIGIVSSAGNRMELNPEQISDTGSGEVSIIVIPDPHTDGCAYLNFSTRSDVKKYDGTTIDPLYLLQTGIKTLPWRQVPIAYTKPEGSTLTMQSFENGRIVKDLQFKRSQKDITVNAVSGAISDVSQGLQAASEAKDQIGFGIAIGSGVAAAAANSLIAYDRYRDANKIYQADRAVEFASVLTTANINRPNAQVSYDCNPVREYFGDLAIVYRYNFTPADEARLDKVLTMYGYKCTVPVDQDLFFTREKFNYVQAAVSVTGDFSKSIADGIALQLSGGVRVWHVLPDVSTYTTGNPIAS